MVFFNPSLLASRPAFSLLYAAPYSIEGLNFYSASVSYKKAGVGIQSVSYASFYETSLNLAYGAEVRRNFQAGFGFELVQLSGDEVENKVRFYGGVATQTNGAVLGVSIFNIYSTRSQDPREISLQISKPLSGTFTAGANFLFQEGYAISTRAGIFYDLFPGVRLTGGYSTNPDEYFASVSLSHLLDLTYSVSFHTYLGVTHVIEISLPAERDEG